MLRVVSPRSGKLGCATSKYIYIVFSTPVWCLPSSSAFVEVWWSRVATSQAWNLPMMEEYTQILHTHVPQNAESKSFACWQMLPKFNSRVTTSHFKCFRSVYLYILYLQITAITSTILYETRLDSFCNPWLCSFGELPPVWNGTCYIWHASTSRCASIPRSDPVNKNLKCLQCGFLQSTWHRGAASLFYMSPPESMVPATRFTS